ncbi:MAG: phosphoribosylformylglycinamidine cyclo-ligase [Planctomycetota bacterium]
MKQSAYARAGVDIAAGNNVVDRILPVLRSTYDKQVMDNDGGFSGLYDLSALLGKSAAGLKNLTAFRKPVLVGCTDGVGTKLKIAFLMNKHDTVGIDLVAMSVNDLIVQGARPLFFLDYVAASKIHPPKLQQIVSGIAAGCRQAQCALLGGETAELPGFYAPGEYDLAGFATGVVDKDRIIDGRGTVPGDIVIGILSNGLHSNGYSLVRKVLLADAKLSLNKRYPDLGETLGEALLQPTRIYARLAKNLLAKHEPRRVIRGIAHITGGGLFENPNRVIPKTCAIRIEKGSWPAAPIFNMIRRLGKIDEDEMFRVFNMGIGLTICAARLEADRVLATLKRFGEKPRVIGEIVKGQQDVRIV